MSAVPEAGSSAHGRRWIFAGAEFDERTFELRVQGQAVDLEPKPLEVLLHLLRHAGEIVTKEELTSAVWPGRLLTENSLPQAVSRIREVLCDGEQALIKTVHGYGYRFVAPVRVESARAKPGLTRLALKAGDHPPLRPNWTLVRQLGSGGQGEVWLAQHAKDREQRVFKFALDLAGLAAIKREITLYRFLRESLKGRDEFTRVIEWNLEEAPYYIELEYGAGGNLESWAETVGGLPGVPLATRLEVVARIAEALAAAHSVGVLHKDLKPTNVLIAPEGDATPRVKLADFGSGSVLDPQRLEALGITRLGFTQSVMQGQAAATAMYLAPEVMGGQPATVQADIYSLGILLYQMVVGDLKQPLASGWERRVGDELLCEDIALAVAGDPARRLGDAAALTARLRTLEERRRAREAEQAEKQRLEQEQQAATERARKAELAVERLRTRRQWMLTVVSVLIVGVAISLGLFLQARQARNEAAAAAASSQAVAEFLSRDMFSVITSRPLRELTVRELLEAASATLAKRSEVTPQAAAQIHGALGSAFWTLELADRAVTHLDAALGLIEQSEGPGSAVAVSTAAQLLLARGHLERVDLKRYEDILAHGRERLGEDHGAIVLLRHNLAHLYLVQGQWKRAVDEFRSVLNSARAANNSDSSFIDSATMLLSYSLIRLADFGAADQLLRASLAEAKTDGLLEAKKRMFLGLALLEQRRFAEADAELNRATELIRPWTRDEQSAHLASIRAIVGLLRLREGRHAEAVALLEESIRSVAGSDWEHDQTYEIRSWLGLAYAGTGRLAPARAALERALTNSEAHLGNRHLLTLSIRVEFADVLRRSRQPAAAREALSQVDPASFAELGPRHPFATRLGQVQGHLAAESRS